MGSQKILLWILTIQIKLNFTKGHIQNLLNLKIQLILVAIKAHHIFNDENEYFRDLSKSWFGLTCIKGGWDSLRHYEILSAGTLLLFRDYENKPLLCSPQKLPCYSYSNIDELDYLMSNLVVKNKPTTQYLKMINEQRKWLYKNGTTLSRAKKIIETLNIKLKN